MVSPRRSPPSPASSSEAAPNNWSSAAKALFASEKRRVESRTTQRPNQPSKPGGSNPAQPYIDARWEAVSSGSFNSSDSRAATDGGGPADFQ